VEVELDKTFVERVEEVYVPRVREHHEFYGNLEQRGEDMEIETRLIIHATQFRKLLISTPASKQVDVAKYMHLTKTDLFSFPSLIAAFSNLGKVEFDEFVVRIKNNTVNIHRQALTIAKIFLGHSTTEGRYRDHLRDRIEEALPYRTVFGDEASAQWIRDGSKKALDRLRDIDFPINNAAGVQLYRASYPKLELDKDLIRQRQNVIEWIGKLGPAMPEIVAAVRYGVSTVFEKIWFSLGNFDRALNLIWTDLPNWVAWTPHEILTGLDLHLIRYTQVGHEAFDTYHTIIQDAFELITSASVSNLSAVFKFAKQPDDGFGTKAQLVVVDDKNRVQRGSRWLEGTQYTELAANTFGTSLLKIKEKGLVSSSLIFGLSREVKFDPVFEARLNGSIASVRKAYLSPDFKPIT